jgi:hypothetical protein
MVDRCLVSMEWNLDHDDAYPFRESWTTRYWQSCMNKLNILNHSCMVTIIGQIKPWGFLKPRTALFIERMEQEPSPWRALIKLGEVGLHLAMILDIPIAAASCSCSSHRHIWNCGYTWCDVCKPHRDDLKNILKHESNPTVLGNLDFMFFEFVATIY